MNTIDLHIHITVDNLSEVIQQIVSACNADKAPVIKTAPGIIVKEPITVKTRQRKQRVLKLVKDNSEPKSRIFGEKICIQCGKTFTPHSGRQVKCDECRSEKICEKSPVAYSDQLITKTCPRCGKEFQTIKTNRVFCYDRNCLKLATKTTEPATTKTCTHTSDQDTTEEQYGRTDYPHTCKSCGRLFFTSEEEPDRELCNDNCRPLTPTEKARQRQILESGDLMFDKEYSSKQPKQQNTNGNHKEKTSKQAKICRQKTVGEIDCN